MGVEFEIRFYVGYNLFMQNKKEEEIVEINLDKKSLILIRLVFVGIVVSVIVTYYNYIILKDFNVINVSAETLQQ